MGQIQQPGVIAWEIGVEVFVMVVLAVMRRMHTFPGFVFVFVILCPAQKLEKY